MKKVSAETREYQARINRKRFRRRLLSKEKRRLKQGGLPRRSSWQGRKVARVGIRVNAPRVFSLERSDSRRDLLTMLETIRRYTIDQGIGVRIDFSGTEMMFPTGTLVLTAEIDRILRVCGKKRMVTGIYPRDLVVEQVLQQVGILKKLGLKPRQTPESFPDNVRHWRYKSGDVADGKSTEAIVEHCRAVVDGSQSKDLYRGLVEAMTNCVQHAYPEGKKAACHHWWMFSQQKDGELTVAFCDLGIGIPKSLKVSTSWRAILKTLLAMPDTGHSALIKAAAELHKSRTNEPHRGKGLGEILDVVRKAKSGWMLIMSDTGTYRYDGTNGEEVLNDFPSGIMGTYVQWSLPLQEAIGR